MNRNPFRKTVGFYEVMTTSYTSETKSESENSQNSSNMANPTIGKTPVSEKVTSNSDSPRNVGFNLKDSHTEKKKKYLTAKYGAHQMLLIKKRLGVEMWIFDELRKLHEVGLKHSLFLPVAVIILLFTLNSNSI